MKLTSKKSLTLILTSLALAFSAIGVTPAYAAGPWYVTSGGNNGNSCLSPATACATINAAIGKAAAGDTIEVGVGTYTETGSEVVLIDKDITLSGGWNTGFTVQTGKSVVDGQSTRRCVLVANGVTATVDGFLIKNGFVTSSEGGGVRLMYATLTLSNSIVDGNNADYAGAGIYNHSSTLNIINSIITKNSGADYGGGIYSYNYFGGALNITNSTISFNQAERGAGIFGVDAVVNVNNSTINNNKSVGPTAWGGGVFVSYSNTGIIGSSIIDNVVNGTVSNQSVGGGGISSDDGTLNIENSTISRNVITTPTQSLAYGGGIASYKGAGGGGVLHINNATIVDNQAANAGGVYNSNSQFYGSGTADLKNTILAGNIAQTGPNCSGLIDTFGYNLIANDSGCTFTPTTGDLVGTSASPVDPRLAPLQNYGGPTVTYALLGDSPALNAGNPATPGSGGDACLSTDQRGMTRPEDVVCDIGAYEGYILIAPLSPTGTVADTTPTYKWTKAAGATKYQYQLVKGSKTIYTKTVTASACGASTCANTPTTVLGIGTYKWRVRAMIGGVWKDYSADKTFTISAAKAGLWKGSGLTFYVTSTNTKIDDFAIYIFVSGCGNYKISHTHLVSITNKHFAFNGSFYATGNFSSPTAAAGTLGLKSFHLPGCGYLTGGPFSWTAKWKNGSLPLSIDDAEEFTLSVVVPGSDASGFFKVDIDNVGP